MIRKLHKSDVLNTSPSSRESCRCRRHRYYTEEFKYLTIQIDIVLAVNYRPEIMVAALKQVIYP